MADYPALPQADGTRLVPRSGMRLRYATNGSVRPRALSSATRYDPMLVHRGLTLAQWQSLQSFYESNRAAIVTVAYGAIEALSINCVFADKPFDCQPQLGGFFNVTVYLVQAD